MPTNIFIYIHIYSSYTILFCGSIRQPRWTASACPATWQHCHPWAPAPRLSLNHFWRCRSAPVSGTRWLSSWASWLLSCWGLAWWVSSCGSSCPRTRPPCSWDYSQYWGRVCTQIRYCHTAPVWGSTHTDSVGWPNTLTHSPDSIAVSSTSYISLVPTPHLHSWSIQVMLVPWAWYTAPWLPCFWGSWVHAWYLCLMGWYSMLSSVLTRLPSACWSAPAHWTSCTATSWGWSHSQGCSSLCCCYWLQQITILFGWPR